MQLHEEHDDDNEMLGVSSFFFCYIATPRRGGGHTPIVLLFFFWLHYSSVKRRRSFSLLMQHDSMKRTTRTHQHIIFFFFVTTKVFFFFFFGLQCNFVKRRSFCLVVMQPYKEDETCLFLLLSFVVASNPIHNNKTQQHFVVTSNPTHKNRINASSTSFLMLLPLTQFIVAFYYCLQPNSLQHSITTSNISKHYVHSLCCSFMCCFVFLLIANSNERKD